MSNEATPLPTTARWIVRIGLTAGTVLLWSYGRFCPPSPAFQGTLLAFTLLGGIVLVLGGILRLGGRDARRSLPDTVLGLVIVAATLAFLFAVLSNQEEPLPITPVSGRAPTNPDHLRIVDFNVLHGIPDFTDQETRFANTLAALRALNPDVLILQEVWNTAAHGNMAQRLAEALQLHFVYARANGSRSLLGFEEGSAILSRFPIRAARRLLLTPRTPWWECRIALVAEIDLGGGKLSVAGLHCHDQKEAVAAAQAHSLLQRLDRSEKVIVAGDFNAGSESPAVTRFTEAGFLDVLPGGIDHLLLPSEAWNWKLNQASWTLRPEDLETLIGNKVAISDHPAIVVDLVRHE